MQRSSWRRAVGRYRDWSEGAQHGERSILGSVLTRRRSVVPVLAGVAVGLLVALVAWVYLFASLVDVAPPRYPTFEAAEPVAVAEGGKYRWPGTTVRVHEVDAQR